MVNYYEVLRVSKSATNVEIKSAYRRLARKLHPDTNNGSDETAVRFAAIAEAYEVLGNAKERSAYDKKVVIAEYSGSTNGNSVFPSANPHVRRWRQMVYEKRYNEIIDRMIAEERRESMAMQRMIYPTVASFVSAILVTALRPKIFENAAVIGKIIVVSLFIVGVIHLVGRIREGYEHFTYYDDDIHDSILEDTEPTPKPYSRLFASGFLIIGMLICSIAGVIIGNNAEFIAASMPSMFSSSIKPEIIFYPPIIVFFVDLMHDFASRFD
ncbi:MAG: J domain-containing protein [Pyrinomonadaceae bacterium]